MANDRLGAGEPPAGDHLQSVYRFWLVGHQLEHGEAPWKDPYSFQPIVEPQTVLGGWPFGFGFWPLEAAFGPVFRLADVAFVRPDVAIAHKHARAITRDGEPLDAGHAMIALYVLVRDDGRWRVAARQNTLVT